ncbi:Serine/threonine-protein kinase WNK1 [Liparis tanakae]|uniref:Serine/threonine-protein kinase WNK1 n=1 Tax=Liparis tanakae TaxID=230148 RepID=A0A4Z2EL07_9TELE|nr:Serine/threonine-protein kinase WNK1 [Liparis tanakae]
MREIQALHSRQKEEIDGLFTRLGKVTRPGCVCPSATSGIPYGSTLSAQSAPTVYPGPPAPGGSAESRSSTLLQPLKPSPSGNNSCSSYASEAALSVPSLCAPTPGCVKFSWGSERLAFKPGGRRTRFLSTPCLALCV